VSIYIAFIEITGTTGTLGQDLQDQQLTATSLMGRNWDIDQATGTDTVSYPILSLRRTRLKFCERPHISNELPKRYRPSTSSVFNNEEQLTGAQSLSLLCCQVWGVREGRHLSGT